MKVKQSGFTLIEMMVAVSLFAVVMTISVSSLLALVAANRKAQAIQSVMNNLNVALDGIVRSVRMGTKYHCGPIEDRNNSLTLSTPKNCIGGELISFESFSGNKNDSTDNWVYWVNGERLYKRFKSKNGQIIELPLTAPEVKISNFKVYVTGAEKTMRSVPPEFNQPKVVLIIKGIAGAEGSLGVLPGGKKIETNFQIQAVASQRLLDI